MGITVATARANLNWESPVPLALKTAAPALPCAEMKCVKRFQESRAQLALPTAVLAGNAATGNAATASRASRAAAIAEYATQCAATQFAKKHLEKRVQLARVTVARAFQAAAMEAATQANLAPPVQVIAVLAPLAAMALALHLAKTFSAAPPIAGAVAETEFASQASPAVAHGIALSAWVPLQLRDRLQLQRQSLSAAMMLAMAARLAQLAKMTVVRARLNEIHLPVARTTRLEAFAAPSIRWMTSGCSTLPSQKASSQRQTRFALKRTSGFCKATTAWLPASSLAWRKMESQSKVNASTLLEFT